MTRPVNRVDTALAGAGLRRLAVPPSAARGRRRAARHLPSVAPVDSRSAAVPIPIAGPAAGATEGVCP